MWRVRNLGTLCSKWDVFRKSLPPGLREACGKGSGRSLRARSGGHQGNMVLKINRLEAHMNKETDAAYIGPAQIFTH